MGGLASIPYADVIDALTGLWVGYDKCPYQIGTPEIERLARSHLAEEVIGGRTIWCVNSCEDARWLVGGRINDYAVLLADRI